MSEMAAVVGWYGPYGSVDEAQSAAVDAFAGGLYVVFGYDKLPAIGRPRFLYVGMAERLGSRVSRHHETIGDKGPIARITSVWLGSIDSHQKPGRRLSKSNALVSAVEGAMIALLRPKLNKRRTTFPLDSFAIINRWWSGFDYMSPCVKPAIIWPDVIECAGPHAPANLCWFQKRPRVKQIARPLK